MNRGGLYSGFESFRVLGSGEVGAALKNAMLALDTNVILSLYRYNENTVDDLLKVVASAGERLFIPHQVVREFWRNRQSVVASLGSPSRDARSALAKNANSSKDAVSRWAKSTAMPGGHLLEAEIDKFYGDLYERITGGSVQVEVGTPTSEDMLLGKLEALFDDAVGAALSREQWDEAVVEGERRVEHSIPPGYMDKDKLESDLPERASGDYILWHQLLLEGKERQSDLVLVTADTKEDWWDRKGRGAATGPRRELVEEYLQVTGRRLYLLEPAGLVQFSSAFEVETSVESVQDIERVSNEEPEHVPWTADAARAVVRELHNQGYAQGEVIQEAIDGGGRISRARVYELDNRDEDQMLRGFTRPVARVMGELQESGAVPYGVAALLNAGYETGVKSSHFFVPQEVVDLLRNENLA